MRLYDAASSIIQRCLKVVCLLGSHQAHDVKQRNVDFDVMCLLVYVITCIFVVGILKRHLNTDQEQQTQQQQQPAVGQQQLQQQTHEQPTHDTRQLRSVDEPQNNDGELQHTELRDGTEWYEDEPWVVYFDHVMGKLGPDANTSDYYDGEFQVNPLGCTDLEQCWSINVLFFNN